MFVKDKALPDDPLVPLFTASILAFETPCPIDQNKPDTFC